MEIEILEFAVYFECAGRHSRIISVRVNETLVVAYSSIAAKESPGGGDSRKWPQGLPRCSLVIAEKEKEGEEEKEK